MTESSFRQNELKNITIYTDGACSGNPGPGGYGVVLIYKNSRKEISGGYRLTTNNRMELKAAIVGLESLKEKCFVKLFSDSQYLVNGIAKGWAIKWKSNNWMKNKSEKALNSDLWDQLLKLCERHTVDFFWVQGHAGDLQNERCDELARSFMFRHDLPSDKGFENKISTTKNVAISKENDLPPKVLADSEMISYEGHTYSWTGKSWVDTQTFTCPPTIIAAKLNVLKANYLKDEEEKITNVRELLDRAKDAKMQSQFSRAERLARRALKFSPGHLGAIAVLCSSLRSLEKPEEALKESSQYRDEDYPPLLATRAAALCDLDKWEQAKKEISKALAIGNANPSWKNFESFRIVDRIKAARPDLYK